MIECLNVLQLDIHPDEQEYFKQKNYPFKTTLQEIGFNFDFAVSITIKDLLINTEVLKPNCYTHV